MGQERVANEVELIVTLRQLVLLNFELTRAGLDRGEVSLRLHVEYVALHEQADRAELRLDVLAVGLDHTAGPLAVDGVLLAEVLLPTLL